jgi:hypothetical protein
VFVKGSSIFFGRGNSKFINLPICPECQIHCGTASMIIYIFWISCFLNNQYCKLSITNKIKLTYIMDLGILLSRTTSSGFIFSSVYVINQQCSYYKHILTCFAVICTTFAHSSRVQRL